MLVKEKAFNPLMGFTESNLSEKGRGGKRESRRTTANTLQSIFYLEIKLTRQKCNV